jgi:hypothetical protein
LNRSLIDGTTVAALDIPITLNVTTKCPWKYKLIDMETGVEYTGRLPTDTSPLHWERVK